MALTNARQLIPQRNIVIFAPHYDDSLFLLGGYIGALKAQGLLAEKTFHIVLYFSRSNYLAKSGAANYDPSLERIKHATGQRLLEDLGCLDELLGLHNYRYELIGEDECLVRGKSLADCEMEFPHGIYEDFSPEEWAIFARAQQVIARYAQREDTALVFPLAFKEHIDHFILREAAAKVLKDISATHRAAFYFQEDKPYCGIADSQEMARIEAFVAENALKPMYYACDPGQLMDLAEKHYITQVEPVYRQGVFTRARMLGEAHGGVPCDRICVAPETC